MVWFISWPGWRSTPWSKLMWRILWKSFWSSITNICLVKSKLLSLMKRLLKRPLVKPARILTMSSRECWKWISKTLVDVWKSWWIWCARYYFTLWAPERSEQFLCLIINYDRIYICCPPVKYIWCIGVSVTFWDLVICFTLINSDDNLGHISWSRHFVLKITK